MSKPLIHAQRSAKIFGGKPDDYIPIHNLMDSTKGSFSDNRHRLLTHNSWFVQPDGILEQVFGISIKNSDGKDVPVREIGEQHILDDFGGKFIPTVQDWLVELGFPKWMMNGLELPPSAKKKITKQTNTD